MIHHVYPVNDAGEHLLECIYKETDYPYCPCPCKPTYQDTEEGGVIIVHNSYDGREGVEWANDLLTPVNK